MIPNAKTGWNLKMKNNKKAEQYLSFFKKELTDKLLFFWMDRCLDKENGGYLNCFSNDGSKLVSTDKYTWSQGRFLWVFSRLATIESDLFDKDQRYVFLSYAKSGMEFLKKHVLIDGEPLRCVFLTDAQGNPKSVEGHDGYDLSISADCFVVMGFAAYARATADKQAWKFARDLGESVFKRYESGNYRSLPYPVPSGYRTHAKPMILTNVFCELYRSAEQFDKAYAEVLREQISDCHKEVFEVFADDHNLVHEFTLADGSFAENLFGQHINPGHTLEDMWFQWEAADIVGIDTYRDAIENIVLKTMELGWDAEYGGIYHFIPCDGLDTVYKTEELSEEPQMKLVLDDWGSKLWWVHSEAMYTNLLLYEKTGKEEYLRSFEKVFEYTYRTFPNPDPEIREWIQIRTRDGHPQEKVVALPVKDPYHIIRNVLLMIELLERK